MAILFKNNASTKLASGITAAATTMSVVAGTGDLFPNPGVGEYFLCTLVDDLGNKEIVKVTARTVDAFTIVRAQEGTTARAFNANSLVENRLTAGALNEVLNVTYASDAEVAAGVETTKAISPATVSSASVASAVTAGTCTGNAATATIAATASDMAVGHVLAGKTTAEAVRGAIGALSPEVGKYKKTQIVTQAGGQALANGVLANILTSGASTGELNVTPENGYLGWTIQESGVYRVDANIPLLPGSAASYAHLGINRVRAGATARAETMLVGLPAQEFWISPTMFTELTLQAGDTVYFVVQAFGTTSSIHEANGYATITRIR